MSDTKQRLLEGALAAVNEHGITGVSARTIAAAAGVNQALVFYHYGSVDDLLAAACRTSTEARVAAYAAEFARVTSLRQLLDVGRRLQVRERALGNVSMLAQLLAAAQADKKLAASVGGCLQLWVDEIESVLRRLLAGSPFAEVADLGGLARAVSAAFVGIELYAGVDETGSEHALAALEQLAILVEVVDDLGPVSRRALNSRINRAVRRG
ncbi:TetR family transcriptional regulator [Dactylosporangium fulvum]|uniref:TetR/AcrR family transcriptional regulator n=1 Tax=Dactylosporangium fulvum TaxID=53359 RepID=A0ABY5VMV6_9ACTN|nr:TetR/AcrR family transcriptional regulator [Dactylosporangium fulvum]UWP79052.1 TetR/AcrR family transcriptional regulator [Dactylosporangium fulvum]